MHLKTMIFVFFENVDFWVFSKIPKMVKTHHFWRFRNTPFSTCPKHVVGILSHGVRMLLVGTHFMG